MKLPVELLFIWCAVEGVAFWFDVAFRRWRWLMAEPYKRDRYDSFWKGLNRASRSPFIFIKVPGYKAPESN